MRAIIVGAGAVGSWLGGALALGGWRVTLVARGTHLEAIACDGLELKRENAIEHIRLPVHESVEAALTEGPFDIALLTVKSFDAAAAAAELCRRGPGAVGRIATFQNGVGCEAAVAASTAGIIPSPVIAGTLTTAVALQGPGVVAGGSKGGVGLAREPAAAADRLAAGLREGGLRVVRYDDAGAMKWSKLLLNMLGSATAAILDSTPSILLRDRSVFAIELAAWREALAVMRGLALMPVALPGYAVPRYVDVVRWLPAPLRFPLLAKRLAASRGERMPGLAADLAAGRQESEVRHMHGAIADTGAAIGVATPVNRVLADLVIGLGSGAVQRQQYVGNVTALMAAIAFGRAAP